MVKRDFVKINYGLTILEFMYIAQSTILSRDQHNIDPSFLVTKKKFKYYLCKVPSKTNFPLKLLKSCSHNEEINIVKQIYIYLNNVLYYYRYNY